MATIKGFSVVGGLTGKLGNVVLQKGQSGQTVMRAYVSEVKNPKSIAQANQRMKAAPVQYARRAMKAIIDHSFEGINYGQKSLNHFVSLAMKGNAAPAQLKGDMRFIPGKYQMSVGSLPPITTNISNSLVLSSLATQGTLNTIAALSSNLISLNTQIHEGDRITICYVVKQTIQSKDFFEFKYDRFNVDTSDTSTLPNVGFMGDEGKLVYVPWADGTGKEIAAACFILSRQSGTNWLRSDATLVLSDNVEDSYFSEEAIMASINSYSAAADSATYSAYYMNQGDVNILRYALVDPEETAAGGSNAKFSADIAGGIALYNGAETTMVYVNSDGNFVDASGTEVLMYAWNGTAWETEGIAISAERFLPSGWIVVQWSAEYAANYA